VQVEAHNWDALIASLKSQLDRFVRGGSVTVLGDAQPQSRRISLSGGARQDCFEYSLPKEAISKQIRTAWAEDRRSMPRSGVIFPDGSILTVLFIAKGPPFSKILSPVMDDVGMSNVNGLIGYVEKYSYCFYPNSKRADGIGYFRYDFHPDSMGNGDLGEHKYFHFHRELEESYRHATGALLDFSEVVSGLEKVLAGEQRDKRLTKIFKKGQFSELLMDLTVQGVADLRDRLFDGPEWRSFPHKKAYESFLDGLT
jgi:hypothetical protein